MTGLAWKERYGIRYKEIDEQHQGLLRLFQFLRNHIGQRNDPGVIAGLFRQLCEYAGSHFATEERYLLASGYPGYAQHLAEHVWFIQQLLELDSDYNPEDPILVQKTLALIKDWFLNHILESDQEYAAWLRDFHRRAEIRGIIYSFDKVVADFDFGRILERLALLCQVPADELARRFDQWPEFAQDFNRGVVSEEEFVDEASRWLGCRLSEDEWKQLFAGAVQPNPAIGELIRSQKGRYRLGLVADSNPWHFEQAIQRSGVFPWFDAATLSFQVKALQPEPSLFQDILDQLELVSEECVFIAGTAACAEAANLALFHGIHYHRHDALLQQLGEWTAPMASFA